MFGNRRSRRRIGKTQGRFAADRFDSSPAILAEKNIGAVKTSALFQTGELLRRGGAHSQANKQHTLQVSRRPAPSDAENHGIGKAGISGTWTEHFGSAWEESPARQSREQLTWLSADNAGSGRMSHPTSLTLSPVERDDSV